MLVLTRGKDESIMVGQNVEVTIVDIRGNTVRLGIAAPKSIPVHRREVFEDIHRGKTVKAKKDKVL
jgi:carbon storage regulator